MFGFKISREDKIQKPIQRSRHFNKGRYKIVDGWGSSIIGPSTMENRREDQILDPSKRARLIDLTRNLVRNSSLMNTILGQLTTNVVSSCGGKVILNFEDEQVTKMMKKYFADFTRNADFYNCSSFNHILKRVLREVILCGDCVVLFDDGVVEGSGKLLLFESEEIVQTTPEAIVAEYGEGAFQIQGKVYSPNGRHIGTVVSRSERGSTQADPTKCYFLKKNPDANPLECNWFQPQNLYRDGRGVSLAASIVGTIHQLEDLVTTELLASRKNASTFCWLTSKSKSEEELPSTFDTATDFDSMTDEQVEQAAKDEADQTKVVSFNHARESSVVYEALPEDYDVKQLDMRHPNDSIEAMIDFLANRCVASLGLSKVFATGNPEDGNWRANQLFSAPAIVEFQKELEKLCDWAFYNTMKRGKFNLTVDDMKFVAWEWKGIDELDEVAHQTAVEMKIRNCTGTLKDELGNDWKETMLQIKEEIAFCEANNIPHPAFMLKSGGQAIEVERAVVKETEVN